MWRIANILMLLLFVLVSCKKKEVTLTYPAEGEEVLPCCTEFTWKGGGNSFRFRLDSTSQFTNPVVDTQISDFQYYYPGQLTPNITYYWKVSADKSEASSRFVIRDITADFTGSHVGTVHYQHWEMSTGLLDDQQYQDTVVLNQLGKRVYVLFSQSPIDEILEYGYNAFMYYDPTNSVNFSAGSNTNHCSLLLNFKNDSIYVKARAGGLGNYKTWEFRARK